MVEKRNPTQEQVERALADILSSERFKRSKRARELLTYLVREALAGRGDGLKAYSIAMDVFSKGADFDAENDTLVRVQAGRLRNLLEHYYDSEGRNAPVLFTLPRGGYAVHFTLADLDETPVTPPVTPAVVPEARARPWYLTRSAGVIAPLFAGLLAVAASLYLFKPAPVSQAERQRPNVIRLLVADRAASQDEHVILHAVRDVASRFTAFDTVARNDAAQADRNAWPEDYRIRVEKVRSGEASFVFLSAEHVASGTVIGAERTSLQPGDPLKTALPIERALIRMLQPLGPIYTDYRRRRDYSPAMTCVLLQHDYVSEQSDERHEKARACAEDLIAKGVEDARLYTALSYLYSEEFADQRNTRAGDPLKRAIAAAQRALEIAPNDSEAHQQLMGVYALTGDFDLMLATGRRAIALNPSNSAIHDNFGAMLNYRGRYEEALQLLQRAEELQPVAPRWRAYAFFLSYYGMGQMGGAVERASTLSGTNNPLFNAARAIVARYKGDIAERADALIAVAREERSFLKEPRAMYERRQYNETLVDRLVDDLTGTATAQLAPGAVKRSR